MEAALSPAAPTPRPVGYASALAREQAHPSQVLVPDARRWLETTSQQNPQSRLGVGYDIERRQEEETNKAGSEKERLITNDQISNAAIC